MLKARQYFIMAALAVVIAVGTASAQTTAFTYQGTLNSSSAPATGNYDFEFALFDAVSGGTQVGATLPRNAVAVANGIFTVSLDFGAQFPGANRFLEIRVRQTGGGAFTTLTPRQQLSSVPYAVRSLNATSADSVAVTGVPGGSGNYIQNTTSPQATSNFNISGNGIIGGNLGIGTTTPGSALDVVGGASPMRWARLGSGHTWGWEVDGAGTHIRDATNLALPLSILNDGKIGFGTPTPNTNLHLKANASQGFAIQMENTNTAKRLYIGNYGTIGAGLHWPGLDSANTSFLYAENPLVFTTPGGIYFSGSTTAEHMRITSGGNVGIGANPGNSRFVVNHVAPNAFAATIRTTGIATLSYGLLIEAGTGGVDSSLLIRSQAGTPFLRVSGNGNVGIGTENPVTALDVAGIARFDSIAGRSFPDPLTIQGSVNITGQLAVQNMIPVTGTQPVCISGDLLVRCSSSSLRYKTDVRNYNRGLEIVRKLQPISFTWKEGGSHDFGLGAEDVEKVLPDLVFFKDGRVEGVKYDRIGVILINAVKEQQEQIERQQNEIAELRAIVCSLKPDAKACQPK